MASSLRSSPSQDADDSDYTRLLDASEAKYEEEGLWRGNANRTPTRRAHRRLRYFWLAVAAVATIGLLRAMPHSSTFHAIDAATQAFNDDHPLGAGINSDPDLRLGGRPGQALALPPNQPAQQPAVSSIWPAQASQEPSFARPVVSAPSTVDEADRGGASDDVYTEEDVLDESGADTAGIDLIEPYPIAHSGSSVDELPPLGGVNVSRAKSRFIYAPGIEPFAALASATPKTLQRVFRKATALVPREQVFSCSTTAAHDARYDAFLAQHRPKVLIAISYSTSLNVLPTILRELPKVIARLGPENVHVSITEGRSEDDTIEYLHLLGQAIRLAGASFTIAVEGRSPLVQGTHRLERLSRGRNRAMQDLHTDVAVAFGGFDALVFVNDVIFCANDFLELTMQHVLQESDMMCGIDYNTKKGDNVGAGSIYDKWVARDIYGKMFKKIVAGRWLPAILSDNPRDSFRYETLRPFQVFSCWNGILMAKAAAFMSPHNIRIRNFGDVRVSESFIISQDLWRANFTRIAMHSRVKVAYNVRLYSIWGRSANATGLDDPEADRIEWTTEPPRQVEFYDYHQFKLPAQLRSWDWEPSEYSRSDSR